jgi:hypothetical protein
MATKFLVHAWIRVKVMLECQKRLAFWVELHDTSDTKMIIMLSVILQKLIRLVDCFLIVLNDGYMCIQDI